MLIPTSTSLPITSVVITDVGNRYLITDVRTDVGISNTYVNTDIGNRYLITDVITDIGNLTDVHTDVGSRYFRR